MTIYQVVDERNFTVHECQYRDTAIRFTEDMAMWYPKHTYHIETLVIEESGNDSESYK